MALIRVIKGVARATAKASEIVLDANIPENILRARNNIVNSPRLLKLMGEEGINKLKSTTDLSGIKKSIFQGYSTLRSDELKSSFLKAPSYLRGKGDLKMTKRNSRGFFQSKIENATQVSEEKHRFFVSELEEEIFKTSGEYGHKVFQDFVTNPEKASRVHGFSEKDLFLALLEPDSGKNPALKSIGLAFRNMDKKYVDYLKDIIHLGDDYGYILPLTPNDSVLRALGSDGYAELLLRHTNIEEKQAHSVAKKVYQSSSRKDTGSIKVTPVAQKDFFGDKIAFNSVDDQYEFQKTILGNSGRSSVLTRALEHKELQLTKAIIFSEFGADPRRAIRKAFDGIIQDAGDNVDKIRLAEELGESEEYLVKSVQLSLGKGYQETSTLRLYSEALDKFISAIYGVPGSLVRQVVGDTTGHAISINHAFLDSSTIPGHINKRVLQPLKPLLYAVARGGKDSKIRKEIDALLHTFNFSTSNNSIFLGQGVKMESFFGSMALQGKGGTASDLGETLNNFASKMNGFVNKVSGNSLHYDTATMINTWNTSHAFTNLFFNKSWDEIAGALGNKTEYLEQVFEIGEKEFKALQHVPLVDLKSPSVTKAMGFEGKTKILLPNEIRKLSDDVARKYKKGHETVETFKARLEKSYYNLVNHQKHLQQVKVSRANRLTARGLSKGSTIDLILRPLTKFWDISHVQHDAIRQGLSISLYGNPWEAGFIPGSKAEFYKGWGRAYITYGSMGLTTVWAKDMLSGREPRPLNATNFSGAFANSGVLGIPGMMISSLQHNSSDSGIFGHSPLGGFIGTASKAGKSKYHGAKALQRASGIGKLWWATGVTDTIIKRATLSTNEQKSLDDWYKKEIGSERLF